MDVSLVDTVLNALLAFVDVAAIGGIMLISQVFKRYLGDHAILLPLGLGLLYGFILALSSVTIDQNTATIMASVLKTGFGYGGAAALTYKLWRRYKWTSKLFNGNGTGKVDTTDVTINTSNNTDENGN